MGFLTNLFGGETNYVTVALALGIVVILIVLVAWLLKLLGQASRTVGRGRNRRLAVIDTVPIDQKRQAILIRRDNVEHLIITGGPNDLVVESGLDAPPHHGLPRPARRAPEPADHTEPKAEAAAEAAPARRTPGGNGTQRTLRHPGLNRPAQQAEPQLGGGNPTDSARERRDSARNGLRSAHDGAGELEAATEAGGEFTYTDQDQTGR